MRNQIILLSAKKLVVFLIVLCFLCFDLYKIDVPKANAMYQVPDESQGFVFVENNNIKKAKVKKYSRSGGYFGWLSFQSWQNTYFYKKGDLNYDLKTQYFLPVKRKYNYALSLMQSIVMKDNYLYVLYRDVLNPGWKNQKGFIARYDMDKLEDLGLNAGGEHPEDLRRAFAGKLYKTKKVKVKRWVWTKKRGRFYRVKKTVTIKKAVRDKKREKQIKSAVKFSGSFVVGHGETLNLTGDGNYLTLSAEPDTPSAGEDVQIYKISASSLKIIKTFETNLSEGVAFSNAWTVDDDDNIFAVRKKGSGFSIYQGTLEDGTDLREVMRTEYRNGDVLQGMTFNRIDRKLYILCDGSVMSMPVDKVGSLDMEPEDVQVTTFKTDREFEGITFDDDGRMWLTIIRGPELLSSTITFD